MMHTPCEHCGAPAVYRIRYVEGWQAETYRIAPWADGYCAAIDLCDSCADVHADIARTTIPDHEFDAGIVVVRVSEIGGQS